MDSEYEMNLENPEHEMGVPEEHLNASVHDPAPSPTPASAPFSAHTHFPNSVSSPAPTPAPAPFSAHTHFPNSVSSPAPAPFSAHTHFPNSASSPAPGPFPAHTHYPNYASSPAPAPFSAHAHLPTSPLVPAPIPAPFPGQAHFPNSAPSPAPFQAHAHFPTPTPAPAPAPAPHHAHFSTQTPIHASFPTTSPANAVQSHHPAAIEGFSTGLFDGFNDVNLCCMTFWFPCITFGRIAEIVDRGSTTCGVGGTLYALILAFSGLHYIYSCSYRSKMRAQFGMPEDLIVDCCIHAWCEPCALCQEYIELQRRGYDLSLGWQGNIEKANQVMVPPSMQSGMVR